MPHCDCGNFVTESYVRVFAPRGRDSVRCCPDCEGIRDGADVRNMRSHSERTTDETSYDATRGDQTVISDD